MDDLRKHVVVMGSTSQGMAIIATAVNEALFSSGGSVGIVSTGKTTLTTHSNISSPVAPYYRRFEKRRLR